MTIECDIAIGWFFIVTLCDWLKIQCHFLKQSEVKAKRIVTYSYAFSRAWRRRHVFGRSFDWLIGLPASVLIGLSSNFAFGFMALNRTPPLCQYLTMLCVVFSRFYADLQAAPAPSPQELSNFFTDLSIVSLLLSNKTFYLEHLTEAYNVVSY